MTGIACAIAGSAGGAISVSANDISNIVSAGDQAQGASQADVTGGSGSYTYLWTPSGSGISFSGTTSKFITASKVGTTIGAKTGSATVVATDTVTGLTASDTISIYLENT